ncbi:MAG: Rrf2 family transcriptional regulator [Candidatus Omnitrophica bacterium]|nr:Rrf2 family transcriptional regulator [Candidatus Omnitrophota bacterium]MDD5488212.1 Rrf2 family transcriptional regulator [Candidatus Omnitrophota bacterium]
MLLTTRSAYGVRSLVNLALKYEERMPVSIKEICEAEGLSLVYLEQIFNRLKHCGIVKSRRGPRGGYMLVRAPEDISVYEVVVALEGGIFPGKCVTAKGKKAVCVNAGTCPSKEVWDEVARKIKEALEAYSFRDLADKARKIDHGLNEGGVLCGKFI